MANIVIGIRQEKRDGYRQVKRFLWGSFLGMNVPRFAGTVLLFSIALPQPAGASPATPIPEPASVPCHVAPRSVSEIIALLKPPPGEGTPWPAYPVPPFPSGEPADPATAAEITAVVRELEACANTGDELRFFAFLSDRWLAQLLRTNEIVAELSALETATPIPVPAGHRVVFPGPWHVERLDDGRVLAAVIWFSSEDAPCLDRSRVRALLFVNHDGRWLIDDIIEHGDDFQDVASVVGTPPSGMLPPWQISCLEQDPIPPAN